MHTFKKHLLLLLSPLAALGQTAAPSAIATASGDKPVVLGSIEVAGQREKPFTTANVDLPRSADDVQPYVILDAASIARSGAVDVQDFLRRNLTMDATRMTGAQGIAVTGVGSSFDLRGLGANHTLILVNGRRAAGGNLLAASSIEQPNLNGIPLGAIERIEVLPTSGSAIYGGSAVGGVINVILKQNYSGGEIRTTYQNTFDGDAPIRRVEASYGLALEGGRTHVSLAAGYSDVPTMTYQERPFLNDYELYRQRLEGGPAGIFTFTTAAPNVRSSPTSLQLTLKPAFGGGALNSSATFVPLGTTASTGATALGAGLLANAGKQNLNLPANSVQYRGGLRTDMGTTTHSRSFLASVRRQMTSALEMNADFRVERNNGERFLSSLQLLTAPASAPVNPFNQAVSVYVAMPFDRPTITESESRQASVGFVLKLPRDWKAQGDYTWSQTRNAFSSWSSWAAQDQTDDLNAGRLNPFVDTAVSPVDLARYIGESKWSSRGLMHDAALRAVGPVGRLPAGQPTLALGLGWREDRMEDGLRSIVYPSFPARDQHILFLGKRQSTSSAYAELNVPLIAPEMRVPLVQKLDLQVAGRIEDYRVDTGTASVTLVPVPAVPPTVLANQAHYRSTQPTVGLRYQPAKGIAFRASHSGGFIPPTFAAGQSDPVRHSHDHQRSAPGQYRRLHPDPQRRQPGSETGDRPKLECRSRIRTRTDPGPPFERGLLLHPEKGQHRHAVRTGDGGQREPVPGPCHSRSRPLG
jgi:outer membrane receptor protein involved in Fe transport